MLQISDKHSQASQRQCVLSPLRITFRGDKKNIIPLSPHHKKWRDQRKCFSAWSLLLTMFSIVYVSKVFTHSSKPTIWSIWDKFRGFLTHYSKVQVFPLSFKSTLEVLTHASLAKSWCFSKPDLIVGFKENVNVLKGMKRILKRTEVICVDEKPLS